MNYYPFHIGDYTSHTARLSLMEDLAYRRLIDAYYLAERPFNGCPSDVAREIGMSDQIAAVEYVLGKFFTKGEDGYSSARCDREIAIFHDKQAKAAAAGRASAERRRNKIPTDVAQKSTDVEETATDVQLPRTNTKNQEGEDGKEGLRPPPIPDCPHQEILRLWSEHLPTAVQPREWTESRSAALRARWREKKNRQDLDWWARFFEYVGQSDFLMGRSSVPGRKPFEVTLDWLLKQDNFVKVIEGKYHEKETQ